MSENNMSRKERRENSDTRIIAAAVKCFGQYGYSCSSLVMMAREAGVTGGLISQRYDGKDMLFLTAYTEVMKVWHDVEETASPRECLDSIIAQIKAMYDTAPEAYAFCTMLYRSMDYPRDILQEPEQQLKQRNIYRILERAQEAGYLPAGRLSVLLTAFIATVFNHYSLCRRYDMPVPPNHHFYYGIHFGLFVHNSG